MTKKITVRTLLVPILLLAALGGVSCSKAERPNVVVVVIDTWRPDHLPFHGYAHNTMPFLASIAGQSADFTRAYAGSSWTAPATASIFTGLYPFQHGVVMGLLAQKKSLRKDPTIQINRIPEAVQTLPEVFKANGYRAFGISDNLNISKRQGFEQGFDWLLTLRHTGAENINRELLQRQQEILSAAPYFLYIHYNDPHRPYKTLLSEEEKTGDWLQDMKRMYDKELAHVDGRLGELYRRFGWERNTLLVVTADHGEEMMERGFYGHGISLYNTVIRVPLLFHHAGSRRVSPGKVEAEASTLDILPTLNGMLGFRRLEGLAGVDLSSLLAGSDRSLPKRAIYSHLQVKRARRTDFEHKAAIAAACKYIFQSPHALSLFFDLRLDPGETQNLYESRRDEARELAAGLFRFERTAKRHNPDYVGIPLDEKSIEHLKTLGYIQ